MEMVIPIGPEAYCRNCQEKGHLEQTCLEGYILMPDVDGLEGGNLIELRCEKCGSVDHSGMKCKQNQMNIP